MQRHHTTIDLFDRCGVFKTAAYLVDASCAADARLRAWRLLRRNFPVEFAGARLCAISVRTGPTFGIEGRRCGRRPWPRRAA